MENISNYFLNTSSSDSCAKRKKTVVIEYAMNKEEMQELVIEAIITISGLPLCFSKISYFKVYGPHCEQD